jgi:hypothetical protein
MLLSGDPHKEGIVGDKGRYTEVQELSVTTMTRAPTVSGAEGEGGGGHHISATLHLVESSHQHRQLIGWDVALRRNGDRSLMIFNED